MSLDPVVTVVLPTFGRPVFLFRAMSSVLSQSYTKIELVVVDDNGRGTDLQVQTEEVVSSYDDSRIKYVTLEKNSGGAVARNEGILNATGSYITFLDDDDEYLPRKVEDQLRFMEDNFLELSLCGAYFYDFNGKVERYEGKPAGCDLKDFILSGNALTPMIMSSKHLLMEIGGFVQTPRFEDHILMIKLLALTPKFLIIHEKLYKCYRHNGPRISNNDKSYNGFIMKHMYETQNSLSFNDNEIRVLNLNQRRELLRFSLSDRGLFFFLNEISVILLMCRTSTEIVRVAKDGLKTIMGRFE